MATHASTFTGKTTANVSREILVAVDFGTTFSSVAWVNSSKPETQHQGIIQEWPDKAGRGLGFTRESVPSTLKYLKEGRSQTLKWGYQIEDTEERHEWFKLDLDPRHGQDWGQSDLASRYPSTTALPTGQGKSTEELVTDYLKALQEHVSQVLQQKLTNAVLHRNRVSYIITVPAVWSAMAQAKTRQCAEAAGMGRGESLYIISEPEAAAMYALDAMSPHDLEKGDTFVVCDAGGGTVDLVSYTVSALKPIPQIHEAAPGTGGLCGSIFLNRIFAKYMRDKFGSDPNWIDEENMEEAMEKFNTDIKVNFRGDIDEDPFKVPVTGLADNRRDGISRHRYSLPQKDVKAIFEPVICEIIKLVENQIKATKQKVTAVLLLGGFGSNLYLLDRLRAELGSNIQVKQPMNGALAVVRGALMKGLNEVRPTLASIKVAARAARMHYGTEGSVPFDPAIHDEKKKFLDDASGQLKVVGMDWFIKKGDTLKESKPALSRYHYERKVRHGPPPPLMMVVYCCIDPKNYGPPTYNDHSVTKLLTLTADLSHIPERDLNRVVGNDQEEYYSIDFEIEMTCYSAHLNFALVYNDVKYQSVKAQY